MGRARAAYNVRPEASERTASWTWIRRAAAPPALSDVARPSAFEANRGSGTLRLAGARLKRAVTTITLITSDAQKKPRNEAAELVHVTFSRDGRISTSSFRDKRFIHYRPDQEKLIRMYQIRFFHIDFQCGCIKVIDVRCRLLNARHSV